MNILKKMGNILFNIFIVLIFVFAILFLVASTNRTESGVTNIFGYSQLVVETDSMDPTLKVGDLIIGKMADANTEIKVSDIISFKGYVNGNPAIITHRVVDITESGRYVTRGDNYSVCLYNDLTDKELNDVICVYQSKISGVGSFILFLKEPIGFGLCFIAPMSIFILVQVFNIFRIYMNAKKEELESISANATPSEEMKDAIIKQYLEEMKNKQNTSTNDSNTEKSE